MPFAPTGGTIEQLVRAIVRDELRRHLGPEADQFVLLTPKAVLKNMERGSRSVRTSHANRLG
jgi:hypothetical protein